MTFTGLEVTDLAVTGPHGPIVTGLDLAVAPGRTIAIVGESGSGKSVSAKAVSGLLPPGLTSTGTVSTDGRVGLLLQNPFTSLSPLHRCGDQIAAPLTGLSGSALKAEIERRLAEVDLPARVAGQYPFELSGGMRQRVALAAALASDPDVLIGDEPTTALDVTTQRQVLDLIARIQAERRMAFILITHDLAVARHQADDLIVMYAGRVVETGASGAVLAAPHHPYTAGLRDSEPPLERRLALLPTMPGSVPHPGETITGCVFAARCPLADERCRTEAPPLAGVEQEPREVACWHPLAPGERTVAALRDAADIAEDPATGVAADTVAAEDLVSVTDAFRRFAPDAPPALDGVSIRVAPGEAVGIVGESGSGKTTLARTLVGLERLDAGAITWGSTRPGPQRAQIVFQDPTSTLNPAMTIGATLGEALRVAPSDDLDVAALLELVGLPSAYARRKPRALSGGELQRVAIARALAPRPELLICDEPVSALDVSVQAQVLNLLNDLRTRLGIGLLLITHDLAVARQVVDRAYVMQRGSVVEAGSMDQILTAPEHEYTQRLIASVVA
ncbi:ABC transporter ATP-binding protein [Nocardioides sp.]|uniref:oligopeptide/dipeptide ABC transporter ATP-binding protein n=1 Tax=Nocardioides sp. TaxID=35761 RepID=UPI002635D954|nr:ABC transporter ATP-binding protein [Nocardioides sp.]